MEAFVEDISMKTSMEAFVKILKNSVPITSPESFFEAFVEASGEDFVKVTSMNALTPCTNTTNYYK